jgi:CheY-like chemotaxis protein
VRETLPPPEMTEDEKDEEALAVRMALSPLAVASDAVSTLIKLYQESNRRTYDILDPHGAFALASEDRSQRIKRETVEELSKVVDNLAGKPVRDLSQRLDVLSKALKDNETRDSEQDKQITVLRNRIESFEGELREMRSAISELSLRHDVPGAEQTLTGRVVLLVEDSAQLSKTLTRVAESRGARVQAAASLQEAEILVAQERPDVAVIDIRLSGADGFAVAAWLASVHHMAKPRMLLMTGATGEDVRLRAGQAGLRVLTKPFGANQLVAAIQDALAQPAEQDPPG